MILAISLCQTDIDGHGTGAVIYTSKIAIFEYPDTALEYAEEKDHILLIDCETGKIIKDANVEVQQ